MAEVVLKLGSETFVLKCTLEAFRAIPASLNGFVGAFGSLASADVDTCIFIIAAATGKTRDFKEHERIAGLLFEQGLNRDLFDVLTTYVKMLQNGGRAEAPNGSAGE